MLDGSYVILANAEMASKRFNEFDIERQVFRLKPSAVRRADMALSQPPDTCLLAIRAGAFRSVEEIRSAPANDCLTATPEFISKFAIAAR